LATRVGFKETITNSFEYGRVGFKETFTNSVEYGRQHCASGREKTIRLLNLKILFSDHRDANNIGSSSAKTVEPENTILDHFESSNTMPLALNKKNDVDES